MIFIPSCYWQIKWRKSFAAFVVSHLWLHNSQNHEWRCFVSAGKWLLSNQFCAAVNSLQAFPPTLWIFFLQSYRHNYILLEYYNLIKSYYTMKKVRPEYFKSKLILLLIFHFNLILFSKKFLPLFFILLPRVCFHPRDQHSLCATSPSLL